jgi:hypothetical protein
VIGLVGIERGQRYGQEERQSWRQDHRQGREGQYKDALDEMSKASGVAEACKQRRKIEGQRLTDGIESCV